jgi:hypothetical protein
MALLAGAKHRVKVGFKRTAVAVARKFAVIMHAMLKAGELFNRSAGAVVAMRGPEHRGSAVDACLGAGAARQATLP